MHIKSMFFVFFLFIFTGVTAYADGWSNPLYVEKIYLTQQGSVVIKVTGNSNINDCLLVEGYQFIFSHSEPTPSKMFELFQTALVNNMRVNIYSQQCQVSSWVNVDNKVTFNQVNHVVLSK